MLSYFYFTDAYLVSALGPMICFMLALFISCTCITVIKWIIYKNMMFYFLRMEKIIYVKFHIKEQIIGHFAIITYLEVNFS